MKGAALLAAAVVLAAGCGGSSSDNPAFRAPASTPSGPAAPSGYELSTETVGGVQVPRAKGLAAADQALARSASGLVPGCRVLTELDTTPLLSFAWKCPSGRVATVTVRPDGRTVQLSDLLTGDYQGYLAGVAATQFQAEGVAGVRTDDLSTWYLTPGAVDVAFPAGVISYPTASLGPYVRPGGGL